jgi:hypothetical protein
MLCDFLASEDLKIKAICMDTGYPENQKVVFRQIEIKILHFTMRGSDSWSGYARSFSATIMQDSHAEQ